MNIGGPRIWSQDNPETASMSGSITPSLWLLIPKIEADDHVSKDTIMSSKIVPDHGLVTDFPQ